MPTRHKRPGYNLLYIEPLWPQFAYFYDSEREDSDGKVSLVDRLGPSGAVWERVNLRLVQLPVKVEPHKPDSNHITRQIVDEW